MKGPGYRICIEGDDQVASFRLHVLARAYRDAYLAIMRHPPVATLRLEKLGVTLEFEAAEKTDQSAGASSKLRA